ncbi:bifunctional lycopene cyclase/phytoene synthase-like [Myzus persicae]|uniref:bifunctional lycopene cyclase/phytoene synthase-like n=1 Tax=Myzus persicae TaxID=13164 RepID=UPI000B931DC0|nr:bifunctional lycopene cyclase/phytoene synthase-like [Myzus persicae]
MVKEFRIILKKSGLAEQVTMLSYMGFHFTYLLPAIGVLALITRPFIDRFEITKIAFISVVALLYATPCYNYNIANEARTYTPERLLGVLGNVPVEEYVSVILQIVLTSLWAMLCVRWKFPFLNFNHDKQSYQTIRWIPILLLSIVTAIGYRMAVPGQETFYFGSILCWASPVIIVMWYGAGNYFVKILIPSAFAIVVPTLYLLWVNWIALKEDFWHLNKNTSLNMSVAEGLPLEEALFVSITTAMIVMAGACYDKAYGTIVTFTLIYPHQFSISRKFICQMFEAFVTPECSLPSIVTEDLITIMKSLDNAKTMFTSCYLYHYGIRIDLLLQYAFARYSDNIMDDASNMENKKLKLKLLQRYIGECFAGRKDYEVKSVPEEVIIDWTPYEAEFTDEEMACFRALSRIAFFLARKPYEELLAGYEFDLTNAIIYKTEKDIIDYFTLIAGSFGAMCVYSFLYRFNIEKYDFVEKDDYVIKKAYQLGNSLQFVNISRDLVFDSESWGRVYLPTDYMEDEENDLRVLRKEKNPRALGNDKLNRYANKMNELCDKNLRESIDVIKRMPFEIRGLILTSVELYRAIYYCAIKYSEKFPNKAKLTLLDRYKVLFKVLYIDSLQYLL